MKEYKPTYCTSLLTFCGDFLIVMPPLAIVIAIMVMDEAGGVGKVLLGFLGCFVVISVLFSAIALVVNLIAKPLSKKRVTLTDYELCYEGRRIRLSDVRYVTLHLSESSRTRNEPQQLSLYADDKNHIVIKRPALSLIAEVRRRCPTAKFGIHELRRRMRNLFIAGVVCAVLFPLITLLEKE